MLGYQPSFCPHTRLPAFPLQSANWATSGGVREHSLLFDSLHLKTEYQTRKTTHTHTQLRNKRKRAWWKVCEYVNTFQKTRKW